MSDDYFGWLCGLVARPRTRNSNRTYWSLLRQLHLTPFSWFVAHDGNRGEDGKELRDEYLFEHKNVEGDDLFMDMDASMFEVLIALSRHIAFASYGESSDWFWKLLQNLDMRHYTDANYGEFVEAEVSEALTMVMQRTYGFDGRGGLFPLRNATTDQRRVELWYQMAAYLLEGEHVDNGPHAIP